MIEQLTMGHGDGKVGHCDGVRTIVMGKGA